MKAKSMLPSPSAIRALDWLWTVTVPVQPSSRPYAFSKLLAFRRRPQRMFFSTGALLM